MILLKERNNIFVKCTIVSHLVIVYSVLSLPELTYFQVPIE